MARELFLGFILIVALGLLALALIRMAPGMQLQLGRRPELRCMLADADYFRRALARLFATRGSAMHGDRVQHDPLDETRREVMFALEGGGTHYAAPCAGWIVPVTSAVVGHFEGSLATTRADNGMIVTTSIFLDGALESGRGLPAELYDQEHLLEWIEQA
jgi:hypothetical protein